MDLSRLFSVSKPSIGVVHLLPLPTSPRWGGSLKAVIDRAEQEAAALAAGGISAIVVENFCDAPFPKGQADPAVISAMTVIVQRLQGLVPVPVGLNVLRNDALGAMAIAACVGAEFIRVNVLSGAMATDQGIIEGCAHDLLRYRRELGCDVKIFADVLVKHAHPISTDQLAVAVRDAIDRGLADAVILSGSATGTPPSVDDLVVARAAAGETPLLVGSGADVDNVAQLLSIADGVIVASSLKRRGRIELPVDPNRVHQFVEASQLPYQASSSPIAEQNGRLNASPLPALSS
ncbi:MAG: BtpA/SgcQ family protein [Cyanobacteria bacterium P01_H01_bin.130]